MLIWLLIVLATYTLQLIGLSKENHFLLIPFIVTTLFEFTIGMCSIVFIFIVFGGHQAFLGSSGAFVLIYIITLVYAVYINFVLYSEYREKYLLNVRAMRSIGPKIIFSELVLINESLNGEHSNSISDDGCSEVVVL